MRVRIEIVVTPEEGGTVRSKQYIGEPDLASPERIEEIVAWVAQASKDVVDEANNAVEEI